MADAIAGPTTAAARSAGVVSKRLAIGIIAGFDLGTPEGTCSVDPTGGYRFGRFTDPEPGPFARGCPGRRVVTGARWREFVGWAAPGADSDAQP